MSSEETIYSVDLAGIMVGDTAISDVQGDNGILSYRGIDITEMVGTPFLHAVWMVLFGEWPDVYWGRPWGRWGPRTQAVRDLRGNRLGPMVCIQGQCGPHVRCPTGVGSELGCGVGGGLG